MAKVRFFNTSRKFFEIKFLHTVGNIRFLFYNIQFSSYFTSSFLLVVNHL